MLPPWVIEKIKQKEEKQRKQREEQPRVYIEQEIPPFYNPNDNSTEIEDKDRGKLEIDIIGDENDDASIVQVFNPSSSYQGRVYRL
ncbi:MAG: hypothetical protein KKA62_03675 [Nanoarchaeota archaeon]|nr:hypothetical protein [Nanoarchaeota archaeon]MBU1644617.1 hypothetical protein [Nanoarchaeota archaeon]MBU1977025.1 hypothetical protein [Nanoarchaeota archaeon]